MASDDLLSESSEVPREGIHQEFEAACELSTGVKGCWKRLTHFRTDRGVGEGQFSASRPSPPPPPRYNTLLYIIRRHITIICIILRVMMVNIILSVSPSNWGKVSNTTMRGCKAKGGRVNDRHGEEGVTLILIFWCSVGESMDDVLVDLYRFQIWVWLKRLPHLYFRCFLRLKMIGTAWKRVVATRCQVFVTTGEVGRLGLALCWFVTWTFVSRLTWGRFFWVSQTKLFQLVTGEWLGLYLLLVPWT